MIITLSGSSVSDVNGQVLFEEECEPGLNVQIHTHICNSLNCVIDNNLIEDYPNIYVILGIILKITVTDTSAEMCFSKLKIIKRMPT
jgi:hypothetical protein